jgi:hypothetical protein
MFGLVLFVYKVHTQLYMLSVYSHVEVVATVSIKTDVFVIKLMSRVMEQDMFM